MNITRRDYIKMIVFIILLVIIPTACFAFDDNSTDLNQNIISQSVQTEVHVSLSGNNTNNGTIENPKLSLDGENGAIAYANDKNITTIILGNGTFDINQLIEINKNNYMLNTLIIKGSGSTILSAIDTSIFQIGSPNISSKPMNISLINLDFTNSVDMFSAISIYHSYVNIINCSFYKNEAYNSASCIGIYYNSTVRLLDSKFYENHNDNGLGVIETGSDGYKGNDLINNIIIYKCQFINNSACVGAAIYIELDSDISIIIEVIDSIFINNSASEGGAIYAKAPFVKQVTGYVYLFIYNSTFKNNSAESAGGAIYEGGNALVEIYDSKFYNNSVYNSFSIANDGVGGAIFSASGSTFISNSEFIHNTASKGGAIFNTIKNDIQIENSTFKLNEAIMGGAVYIDLPYDYGSYSLFDNVTFDSNIGKIGEAIFANDLNMENGNYLYLGCYNSNFNNNSLYNVGNLELINNTFLNSDVFNTGNLEEDNNNYTNSSVQDLLKKLNIKFLNNVSGYYGDVVKIRANVTSIPNDIIIFVIGIREYIAEYNETTGLYEYDYKIINGENVSVSGYSLIVNDCSSNEINVDLLKLPVNLTLDIKDIYVGENLNVTVYLNVNNTPLDANVVVKIKNKDYNVFVKNGYGSKLIDINNLDVGSYNASAIYGKNSLKYEYTIINSTFNVFDSSSIIILDNLNGTIIDISNVSGYYGESVMLYANITKDNKIVFYDGLMFKVNNELIPANFNILNKRYEANYLINQNKTTKITVSTNDNPLVHEGVLNLIKYNTDLKINIEDITFNKSALVVNVTLKSNKELLNGTIKVIIGNKVYNINVINGYGKTEISGLSIGNYTAIAKYEGSNLYDSSNSSTEFKVLIDERAVSIISHNIELYCGNGTRFYITLLDCYNRPIANEKIIFKINGVSYNKITNNQGITSIAINLDSNVYLMNTIFNGSSKYDPITVVNNVTVLSTIQGNNITKIFRNGTQYYAKFLDNTGKPLVNSQVSFNINGVFYYRTTDNNGFAKLNINLGVGTYILTANNFLNNEKRSNLITVLSSIQGSNLVKYFQNDSQYYVKFLKGDGTPLTGVKVSFNINGVFYYRTTDNNGFAKLNINLNYGVYVITVFNPDCGQYYSNRITVLSVLKTENLIMNYRDGTKFTAIALDGNGNPFEGANIKFNINGVFYDRVTNQNGTASLNINLIKGNYIISTYWGKAVISNTITIY